MKLVSKARPISFRQKIIGLSDWFYKVLFLLQEQRAPCANIPSFVVGFNWESGRGRPDKDGRSQTFREGIPRKMSQSYGQKGGKYN